MILLILLVFPGFKYLKRYGNKKGGSSALIAFFAGLVAGLGYEEFAGVGLWYSYLVKTDKFNVCFTPPSGCGTLIAGEVANAKESIYVQAFDITSNFIVTELIRAHKRGIKVRVLLDRTNKTSPHSKMRDLQNAGVDVVIDRVSGIAHNKVMIIDRKKVITGSFNFTNAADKRNSENVVLIDDKLVAERYLKNWLGRKQESFFKNTRDLLPK